MAFLCLQKQDALLFLFFSLENFFSAFRPIPLVKITQLPKVSGMLPPPGASVNILQTPHGA